MSSILRVLILFVLSGAGHLAFGQYHTPEEKLSFCRQVCLDYYPELVEILNFGDPSKAANTYLEGESEIELIRNFSTLIHEQYHLWEKTIIPEKFHEEGHGIYLGKDIKIPVIRGNVFHSSELDRMVPDSLKELIFRYKTYITDDEGNSGSQIFGVYGLLEEMSAYYLDAHIDMELEQFYTDRFPMDDVEEWSAFLVKPASSITAGYEFRIFIAWYVEYARNNYKEIYHDIINNHNLRLAYTLIEEKTMALEKQHHAMVERYIEKYMAMGVNVYIEKNTYLWFEQPSGEAIGRGLFWDENQFLSSILEEQYMKNALNAIRLPGVTSENWLQHLERF